MGLSFEFDTFMSEKIKPGFESGKIKDIEEVHYRICKFLNKWEKKKRGKEICYGVHDSLYAIRDVIDRLDILISVFTNGDLNSFRSYNAFSDVTRDVLENEVSNLTGIIKDLNGHFPDQAIELENED